MTCNIRQPKCSMGKNEDRNKAQQLNQHEWGFIQLTCNTYISCFLDIPAMVGTPSSANNICWQNEDTSTR